ncbi:uncharacterized protein LOC116178597 isoform X2 [Photinus pyralis]|uniref:uncharacterized protein LOC116178597 isoform X2 n=1 Tax=Photinus pyralis TaxID=7054 RepID=UPI0012676E34|nr:uncharacterized protein LOC116178597 isoform X2 [Photinus pyralis]
MSQSQTSHYSQTQMSSHSQPPMSPYPQSHSSLKNIPPTQQQRQTPLQEILVDKEETAFERSKKVIRSPDQRSAPSINLEAEPEMEEIKILIKTMAEDLKKEIKNNNDQLKKNTDEIINLKQEMQLAHEERKKEMLVWQKEKEELHHKIKTLEEKFEKQEKFAKRINVVIKGIEIKDNMQDTRMEVGKLFKEKMEIDVIIQDVVPIRSKHMVIVKLSNFDSKLEVLRNKKKIGAEKIYIDSDLTSSEQKIQAEIRRMARDKRRDGHRVKVAHQKLQVDAQWYHWDEHSQSILPDGSKN